ncbi:MAG: HAMP domain-containing sensor histidine kinase, partial [Planctomycetota bacterium]
RDADEQQRFLQQMESEIDRLADLVERVLEYGRAGQGKTASREVVTDPGELVEDVVEQFRDQLPTEAPLTVETAQHFHPVVLDQEAVKGVVMNLLTNAQKYSPEGSPIEVTVGEESRQLYIRVRDHGSGIRRRELRRIFRPFQRGPHNSRIPGFGLGLAYCKQVATAHRGQIRVWSRVGAGSAFTLEIPLSPGQTTEQGNGEEPAGS